MTIKIRSVSVIEIVCYGIEKFISKKVAQYLYEFGFTNLYDKDKWPLSETTSRHPYNGL
jgi:hypothetical protein